MRKLFFILTAVGISAFTFTSCETGEDRLTDEEINMRADSIFAMESAKLTEEMTLRCDDRMDTEVQAQADQLVAQAQANPDGMTSDQQLNENSAELQEQETIATDADAETEEEEISDEQKIRNRVDERLATLKQELEQQCQERLTAMSRMRADSILTARGMEATTTTSPRTGTGQTGTGTQTGKTTEPTTTTPTNPKEQKMEGQGTTDQKKRKMEGDDTRTTDQKQRRMEGDGN